MKYQKPSKTVDHFHYPKCMTEDANKDRLRSWKEAGDLPNQVDW